MKSPKSIFFLVYFVFHVALLIVSIYVNYRSEDFEFLLYLREKMSLMVWVSAVGMLLFFINMLVFGTEKRTAGKDKSDLQQEINALKAKMFDLQEATSSSHVVENTISQDESEKNKPAAED